MTAPVIIRGADFAARPLPARLASRLRRERKALSFDFSGAQDGEFEGYASVFGVEDQARDIVAPGAFKRSLRARGVGNVKLLYQHYASEPIGVWTAIEEDERGLRVRGRLLPQVSRAREVLALMRAGALDGLSIGFEVRSARRDRARGTRTLTDVELWEISIVTFPLLREARVTRVKRRGPLTRYPAADAALLCALREAAGKVAP